MARLLSGGVPLLPDRRPLHFVFQAALHSHLIALTIIGLLNSAVAAFYYLRVIAYLSLRTRTEASEPEIPRATVNAPWLLAVAACLLITFWLGIFSSAALSRARTAGSALLATPPPAVATSSRAANN